MTRTPHQLRLRWSDKFAILSAVVILAGMTSIFLVTVIAAGGLSIERLAIYFGLLTLQAEVLVVGSLWVIANLIQQAASSANAAFRSRAVYPPDAAPVRAQPLTIGAARS